MRDHLGIGVVGAGRFGTFVTQAIADLPGVSVTAVTDLVRESAERIGEASGATVHPTVEGLLDDDAVRAVVVSAPPDEHARVARAALEAGRHVFCEKPLALDPRAAHDIAGLAHETGLVVVVDHVLRYNPLLSALRRLGDGLLGDLQRFCFENDASDEDLGPGHWFWDVTRSGGIFVEHGVHFFDAATMLLGREATSVHAVAAHRAGGPVDLVSATVRHGAHVLATHTHGFAHAHRCERQLMRLDYGPCEVRVEGWIPVHAVVDGWTDDPGVAFARSLPGRVGEMLHVEGFRLGERARIDVEVEEDAGVPQCRGRGQELRIPHRVRAVLSLGGAPAKAEVYRESVRAAMADLVRCVGSGAAPLSGAREGAAAVTVADAAARSAEEGRAVEIARQPA